MIMVYIYNIQWSIYIIKEIREIFYQNYVFTLPNLKHHFHKNIWICFILEKYLAEKNNNL